MQLPNQSKTILSNKLLSNHINFPEVHKESNIIIIRQN